jgi:carboxypeptidase Taq
VLYDTLLEDYEPGLTTADVTALLGALREELTALTRRLADAPVRADESVLRRDYPVERQRSFGESAAAALGLDFRRARLDTSVHPFCTTLGPHDCRITTRFDARHFSRGFFTILHEVGHALYEQGLDPADHGLPAGEAASAGLHESQARLWENLVGRSRAFWEHFFPAARAHFPEALADVPLERFALAVNRVAPSPNRTLADEVTYNLHIQVRFELERALLVGDLPVGDLPGAWAETYRRYLGVTPPDDREGCLQDGHWASGMFGYFPSYTLGNVFSAQLFEAACRDLGGLEGAFARGDFAPLLDWLRRHVHRHGGRYPVARLLERATGSAPDPQPFVRYLLAKYEELYKI